MLIRVSQSLQLDLQYADLFGCCHSMRGCVEGRSIYYVIIMHGSMGHLYI